MKFISVIFHYLLNNPKKKMKKKFEVYIYIYIYIYIQTNKGFQSFSINSLTPLTVCKNGKSIKFQCCLFRITQNSLGIMKTISRTYYSVKTLILFMVLKPKKESD
ncbi:hypothetical protein [Cryptosporidium parvum Iowa II]|uniref:Uncharacterized protein n=2 Tax=Cryptosporidium parvum TaxID=5807 RepID=Q5CV42_CRYPI|nr:hypothetical protein [Cryptosporidium parvum Iowa II]EAK89214.1 hypothetical protein cgd3_370 [Cryptosporidium parvum Iowa II]QOY42384.1 Uncharacterized protein CPATCC_0031240 [Cryptosporidium parvum]WRK31269.1 Uncharacterized protein cpbgf_300370 [Cryptosporidium parvum]|eukprot:QOY42384.1 hypothetical protein CPATCC_001007 [Cryptosporidium parvum]